MPKLVDAEAQRRQIRRAARRVFARRGVAGTGLAHVAAAAGMGRSSLYHYYPDKAALLGDLVREILDEEAALFAAAAGAPGRPLERVEKLTAALVGLFDQWAAAARMSFDLRLRDAPRFRPFFRQARADLASLIADGQRLGEIDPALDPHLAAATVIGAVDGLLLQYFVEPRAFPDRQALSDAVLGSVRKVLRP